jgi:type II secretion system protein G
MHRKKIQGFTLIELLLVIAIMGILMVIGIFSFTASQQRGRDSKRKQELSKIADALEMYASDFGSYPFAGSDGTITGCGPGGDTATACTWGQAWVVNSGTVYMQKLPTDPVSGQYYRYARSGNGYYLFAGIERSDDVNVVKVGTIPTTYTVSCGSVKCNYVLRSSNITVTPTVVAPK